MQIQRHLVKNYIQAQTSNAGTKQALLTLTQFNEQTYSQLLPIQEPQLLLRHAHADDVSINFCNCSSYYLSVQ